jgi:hypothetical protein
MGAIILRSGRGGFYPLTFDKSILNFIHINPIKEVIAMRRGLLVWRPFEELERIRREFDRLMEEFIAKEEPAERFLPPRWMCMKRTVRWW